MTFQAANSESAAVIGAGIAGLVAAKRLLEQGYAVEVFEASAKTGGLIEAGQLGDFTIDLGAESFAVATDAVPKLCAQLGIENLIVSPARSDARILSSAGTHKIPHGVLGIPSNLDDPEVTLVVGQAAVASAKQLDAQPWRAAENITIADLVSTRLGQPFVDKFLTPVIAGVHSSDPQKLEVASVSPRLLAKGQELGSLVAAVAELRQSAARPGAAVSGIEGGMHRLVATLEQYLRNSGVKFSMNSTIADIEELNAFSKVVVATGVHGAAQLLRSKPALSQPLSGISAVDAAVVALLVESSQLNNSPRGSGVLVTADFRAAVAKAATHVNAKWAWLQNQLPANTHILRFSFGRDGVLPAQTHDLATLAATDAATIFGVTDLKVLSSVTRFWPKALVQTGPGQSQIAQQVREALSNDPRIEIIGGGIGGNGISGILMERR